MASGVRRGLPRRPGYVDTSVTSDSSSATASERASDSADLSQEKSPTKSVSGGQRRGLPRRMDDAAHAKSPSTTTVVDASDSQSRRGLPRTGLPSQSPSASVSNAGDTAERRGLGQSPSATRNTASGESRVSFSELDRTQKLTRISLIGVSVLAVLALSVLLARWLVGLEPLQAFMTTYPGEYELPAGASSGFPAWVQWQHFFNVFLIILIIRSGLQVRREQRPSAYWTPKWSKGDKGKISLSLWFHQTLDLLWIVNGVVFILLLFSTDHWMRIVPTSWEVFPNAFSAMLQYASLDWPTENGWVNYNSLQQIMYFITVFIAAPLAVLTGFRMSGLWPKKAKGINKLYPVEWARAVHFPVMLYFVVFIIIHVGLVFATGALRNLNHMYGGTDVVNWSGFWIFFVSLALIVAAWLAARPVILAQIAKLSGRVTAR